MMLNFLHLRPLEDTDVAGVFYDRAERQAQRERYACRSKSVFVDGEGSDLDLEFA